MKKLKGKAFTFRDKKLRWSEMEPISEQKFSVTKPVNFDPSKRPRRQDLKVSIDNFSWSKISYSG